MPKIALIIIGCLIGYMFTGWSLYMLYHRMRTPKEQRKHLRVKLWVVILVLLIGVADGLKSTRDLIKYVRGPDGQTPRRSVK